METLHIIRMEHTRLASNSSTLWSYAFVKNNASSNGSQDTISVASPTFGWQLALQLLIGAILVAIIVGTIIGNSLVISAVISFRRLRSVTNYFVVSLAVTDITVAVLVMPYSLLFELYGEWRFGWIFCYFWISCDVMCCTASILHLCVISLDRYLAITGPLSYHRRMSRQRAITMICTVWFCSSAISFVPIYLGWFANSNQMELYVDTPECGLYVNKVYAVISSSTSFYIPLIVMFFAYAKIFKIAHMQAHEIKRLELSVKNSPDHRKVRVRKKSRKFSKDIKAIRTLGTLMSLFCLSWLPFFLMYLILPFCEDCWLPPMVASAITWLGYANSCINPCVYAFLNRDFRMAFKKLLTCPRLCKLLKCPTAPLSSQPFGGASVCSQELPMNELKHLCGIDHHNGATNDGHIEQLRRHSPSSEVASQDGVQV